MIDVHLIPIEQVTKYPILCDHGTDNLRIEACGTPATWLSTYPFIRYACDKHAKELRSKQVRGTR